MKRYYGMETHQIKEYVLASEVEVLERRVEALERIREAVLSMPECHFEELSLALDAYAEEYGE
ncbi:MAG: hypothetical protein V3W44_10930 [Dehalococcoidales bacterium]